MKIIQVDNFDREGPGFDHILIADNVSEQYAEFITSYLIDSFSDEIGSIYFRLVPDDFKLQKFEP